MKLRLLTIALTAGALLPAWGQVTFERLLNANKEPQNWLTHSGTMNSQRHSLLTQITPLNAKNLELQWAYQAKSLEKYEATPLVVDGILYTVEAPNNIVALDAVTGRVFWTYTYRVSPEARVCCGRVNRGLAILGDTLFMGTIDAHLIAVDAKNGRELWNIPIGKPEQGYSITHAPLILKDKVIVGVAGGEYGIRGYIGGYDAKTGKEAWKFYTIPGPGEPGNETWSGDSWKIGGAPVWVTGSYDPETNLTFWGIGNAGPDWNGDSRVGDNLYSSSVVALDADTGKLKWHYQFSPHDEFDYDATQVPVLVDGDWQGKPRKMMMWANRNGIFYVLDRATGQFLLGKPFVKVTWMDGFDEKGRPHKLQSAASSKEGTLIFPGNQGGTNWYNPSYSPRTGLFYIPTWDNYSSIYTKAEQEYEVGKNYAGGRPGTPIPGLGSGPFNYKAEAEGFGAIRAIDPKTGQKKWDFKMGDFTDAGILTTASDVLFSGGREGYFYALDARNGTLLWKATLGGRVTSGPITYSVNNRQYVSINAGNTLFVFALRK